MCREFFEDARIVVGRYHNGDIAMVFCRCTHHGRAANVDVFHGVFQGAIRVGHSGLEGVEVDDHKIDRGNPMLDHDGIIGAASTQNATVNFRV